MTVRTDVSIDWYEDPRIANITTASDEITVQDSHDTLATIEDDAEGHQFPFLVSSAGKEGLGGGTEVGITSTLQNVQYAPQRSSPRSTTTDTVTTGGTNGFICSAATFQSDGVTRGDYVINWTDQSVSEVLTVVSETELTTRTPSGLAASSNDFAVSDVITVWESAEFNLAGGNFVAVDDVGGDLNPVFPVFGRFISKASASSATTQSQGSLNFATYQNQVQIDQGNITGLAQAGTEFPAGTGQQPVLSLADAQTIAIANGFSTLRFRGDYTFLASDNLDSYQLVGDGPSASTLDFAIGTSTERTIINRAEVTGDLGGAVEISGCHIEELTGLGSSTVETSIHDCLLEPGTVITLTAGATERVHIVDCRSGSPGDTPVSVDWNGTGPSTTINGYLGGMRFLNITNTQSITFSGDAHLTVDVSCTDGAAVARGDVYITDEASGNPSFTVTDQTSAKTVWEQLNDKNISMISLLELIFERLDMDSTNPNDYSKDGTTIVGPNFTLTRTEKDANTWTVTRS